MKYLGLIALFIISLVFFSCSTDEQNGLTVQEYITQEGLESKAMELDRGVFIVFETVGNGKRPVLSDRVNINYKGYLTDGTVFDQSDDETFNLSRLIVGWQVGITQMPIGSTAKLIIPSSAGYGSQRAGQIPPNSTLIFDIDLIDVK